MAQIPGPESLGQLTPQVQRMTVQGGSDAIARGAAHLGQRLGQIADEAMQRQEEANRLKTAAQLSQYETDLTVLRRRVQDDLTGGKIASREEAQKRYEEEAQALSNSLYENVPAGLRDAARMKGDEVLTAGSLGFGEFLDLHAVSESRGNHSKVRSSLANSGLADEESLALAKSQFRVATDANARALRYSPEERSGLIADFNADATFQHFNFQMEKRADDIAYIRSVKARLSDTKDLTDLDGVRREQLLHSASAFENAWESEQRRKKAEAEASLANDASEMRDYLLNGGDIAKLNPRDRSRFNTVLGSEKYGGKASGWLQTNRAVSSLNTLPVKDQANALLEAQAAVQNAKSVEDYNKAHDALSALQQNYVRNVNAFQADPFTYTATRLLKEDVQPINWQDTDSLPEQLRARREQAGRASRMNGSRVPPLTAADAAVIAQTVSTMPPQAAAKFLATVRDAVGIESMPLVAQLMSKEGDPVLVGAAVLASKSLTNLGRDSSEVALRGRTIIKNKEVKMPEETGLRATFAADTGMSGQTMEVAFQTAQAIYAAKAREEGVTEPVGGKPDARLWRQSVAMATGGVYDYRGEKLIAPIYGLPQADFEDRMWSLGAKDIERDAGGKKLYVDGQEISYEKAQSYLRHSAFGSGSQEGTVWVRAGSSMILTEDGTPLLLTVPRANPSGRPIRINTAMMTPGM